jgi:ABC-type glycerol-3-phosphate transport system permease component
MARKHNRKGAIPLIGKFIGVSQRWDRICEGAIMVGHRSDRSPSPSTFGYPLARRSVLKGAAGAAASMYVALPTLIVYFALQRYFIAGLTIGAEKG